ncbi:D-tyrosyl-tRNA(Tyr) deacylase [Candidatus Micrarchaeota archaeon]|nr:D-tyrosyl-tRNA(Tyr) deacylase [Candidatus Micrarchaeota archaeon]
MPLIAFSKDNLAGEVIARQLIERHQFDPQPEIVTPDTRYAFRNWKNKEGLQLIEIQTTHLFSDYLKDYPLFNDSDLLIFASTHRSAAVKPCVTTHLVGNWGEEAKLGGTPRELGFASAHALKCAYEFLSQPENAVEHFPPFMEATHHGPTRLNAPILFMEVGSSENEWKEEKPAVKVAEGILHVCKHWKESKGKVALGFGGMHYAPKFSKLELEEYAFSHIASKHVAPSMTKEMVEHAMAKTIEKVEIGIIEKKSLKSEDRHHVIQALEQANLPYLLV